MGELVGVPGGRLRNSESHPAGYGAYSSCHIPISSPDYPVQHDFYISSIWSIKSITYRDHYAFIPLGTVSPSVGTFRWATTPRLHRLLKLPAMGVAVHSFQANCIKALLIGHLNSNQNQNSCICLPGRGCIALSGVQTRAQASRSW